MGWIVLITLARASSVTAQGAGTLSGTVLDETGGALPGVSVEVRGTPLAITPVVTTDSAGRYQIAGIPTGRCLVGPRSLIENNRVRSRSANLLNGEIGYRLRRDVRLVVDVFNLLNSRASDIDYYYTSRLPGEPLDGVNDIHTHPMTGRTARVGVLFGF